MLRKIRHRQKAEKVERRTINEQINFADQALWDELVALRTRLATEQKVPPYVICHNRTLFDLVQQRPTTEAALFHISGLGVSKIAHYGSAFLNVIAANPHIPQLDNTLSQTVNQTVLLHLKGQSLEAIAETRELALATIYDHFADAIEAGVLDLDALNLIDEGAVVEICQTFEELNVYETGKLKPSFEALEERYSYGILKCVLAEKMLTA